MTMFSVSFLDLARRFTRECEEVPAKLAPYQLPAAVVILVASAVEAFVNEELEQWKTADSTVVVKADTLQSHPGTKDKWQAFLLERCGRKIRSLHRPVRFVPRPRRATQRHRAPVEVLPGARISEPANRAVEQRGTASWAVPTLCEEPSVGGPRSQRWLREMGVLDVLEHGAQALRAARHARAAPLRAACLPRCGRERHPRFVQLNTAHGVGIWGSPYTRSSSHRSNSVTVFMATYGGCRSIAVRAYSTSSRRCAVSRSVSSRQSPA